MKRLKNDDDGFTTYEILQQLSQMPEYDTEEFTVRLANGEFFANRHCDEMLDILLQTKWKIQLISNYSIYNEKFATLLENGRVKRSTTSLDAGTRETFQKIKQVDRFDKVVENLKRYPLDKTRFSIKYIFLEGINDNETDIDGFYEIAKEIGGNITLSADENLHFAPWTDKMRELALRIIKKAKADNIAVLSNSAYINRSDAKFIRDSYNNA